jgi:hypothetical protein
MYEAIFVIIYWFFDSRIATVISSQVVGGGRAMLVRDFVVVDSQG